MGLDVVYNFLAAVLNYIPSLFAGVLILVVGLLVLDLLTDYLKDIMEVEGSNV
ncbi:mechanosensitive ion channel family protein [Methanococcoides burtonii]|uniref:mechanosensitive ion channel family protein n=1 Tax=Methanococcoides burtonii TaxID=29291 RepID=UPI00003990A2|nr:hypothetical protein [Methanococcoides burtonii]